MSPLGIGALGIVVMLVLMALRMPIALAMMAVGFGGVLVVYDFALLPAVGSMGIKAFAIANHDTLIALPLFILMGQFAFRSGISTDLFLAARRWMGHWPGGLAVAAIGACAGFSAICGSSLATAAAVGAATLPEMKRHSVDPRLATGALAAGGGLGILIPPSTGMILYGLMADQSIGRLLIAGLIPGLMLAALFIVTIVIWVGVNPAIATRDAPWSLADRLAVLTKVLDTLLLFLLVMGGMYLGVFTPTEASAIGAAGAGLIAWIRRRLTFADLRQCLFDTSRMTAMIFLMVIGGTVFNTLMTTTHLPDSLARAIVPLELGPVAIMLIILAVYIVLGALMDTLAMIVLTLPIVVPIVAALGFDLIWFGVIIMLVIEMALITPPVGMNVFIIKGIAEDVPMEQVFAGIMPFLVTTVLFILMLIAFPQIALWLPNQMY